MNLKNALQQFLRFLKVEKDPSDNTLKAYASDLEQFTGFLDSGGTESQKLNQITSLDVKDYLATVRDEKSLGPTSLARLLSSLRQFFIWAKDQGLIESDIMDGIQNPKIPKKLPVFLVEEEVNHLLSIIKTQDDWTGRRDYALINTFLYTGLRLSEIRDLNHGDLDLSQGTLLVVSGKGRKQRLLPLHDKLIRILDEYLFKYRQTIDIIDSEAVYLKLDGSRMTSRAIGYALERALQRAGMHRRYTPHKLRHTFATQLLHHGGDLLEIKKLMGHEQLSTTSIYTHTNITRLEKAVKKLNIMD